MRKLILGTSAALIFLLSVLLALATPARCPVTEAACERITVGMTVAEVESILGGPPGDYRTMPVPHPSLSSKDGGIFDLRDWCGNQGGVEVFFDASGRVQGAWFEKIEAPSVGPVEMISWRLTRLRERCAP